MSGGSFYGSYGSIDIDNESENYTIPQLIAFLKTANFLSTDYEKVQRRLIMREEKVKLEAMEAARREAVGVAEIEKIRKEVAAEAEARVRNELVKTIQKEADEKMAACKREDIGRVRREAAAIKKKMEEKMEVMRSEAARQLDREKTCAEILEMRLTLSNKMKLVAELKLQDYEKEVADMKLRLSKEMKAKEVAVKEADAAKAKKEAAYELNEKTTAKLLKEINKVRQEVVKKAKIIDDQLFKKNLGGASDQILEAKFQELKKNNDLLRSERDQAYKEKLLLEERFRVNEKRFEDLRKAFLELKKESDLKSSTIENQKTQLAVSQALKSVAVHEKKVSDDKVKQMEFNNNILQMRKAYDQSSLPWVAPLSDPMGKFDQSANGTRSSVNDKGKAVLDVAARGDDGRAQASLGLTNKVANASGIISPEMIQFIKLTTEGPASIAHKSDANVTGSVPLNANMNNVKELGKPPRSPSKNLNIGWSQQLGDKRKQLASPIVKEPATKAARSCLIVGKEAASPASYSSIQFIRESKLSGLCLCPSPVENNHKEGHSDANNIAISNNSKGTFGSLPKPNRPNSEDI